MNRVDIILFRDYSVVQMINASFFWQFPLKHKTDSQVALFEGVAKSYQNTLVLDRISFVINKGEVLQELERNKPSQRNERKAKTDEFRNSQKK
jgi:peroxiredoxin